MRASDVMTQGLVTITPETPVAEAIVQMYSNDVRHLPVVRDGRIVGMITDRDLRQVLGSCQGEGGRAFDGVIAGPSERIMSQAVMKLPTHAPIDQVIALMVEQHIGAVPIISEDDGDLVGIISYEDVLRVAYGRLERQRRGG